MSKSLDLGALSDRESQLLEMAMNGQTDQAIANELGISAATVGTYWGRIRIKVGPLNRAELVALYVRAKADAQFLALRRENEELARRIQRLEKEDFLSALQGVIDAAEDAILVVDTHGVIVLFNHLASDLFRANEATLTGREVLDFVPEAFRSSHESQRQAYLEAPERRRIGEHRALMGLRCDGEPFAFSATLNTSTTPSGELVTCVIRELPTAR
jgi:PAS domain S-box-containing protein